MCFQALQHRHVDMGEDMIVVADLAAPDSSDCTLDYSPDSALGCSTRQSAGAGPSAFDMS